jgi:hypothetical protein
MASAGSVAEIEMKAAGPEAEPSASAHCGEAVRQIEFKMPSRAAALPEPHLEPPPIR